MVWWEFCISVIWYDGTSKHMKFLLLWKNVALAIFSKGSYECGDPA